MEIDGGSPISPEPPKCPTIGRPDPDGPGRNAHAARVALGKRQAASGDGRVAEIWSVSRVAVVHDAWQRVEVFGRGTQSSADTTVTSEVCGVHVARVDLASLDETGFEVLVESSPSVEARMEVPFVFRTPKIDRSDESVPETGLRGLRTLASLIRARARSSDPRPAARPLRRVSELRSDGAIRARLRSDAIDGERSPLGRLCILDRLA